MALDPPCIKANVESYFQIQMHASLRLTLFSFPGDSNFKRATSKRNKLPFYFSVLPKRPRLCKMLTTWEALCTIFATFLVNLELFQNDVFLFLKPSFQFLVRTCLRIRSSPLMVLLKIYRSWWQTHCNDYSPLNNCVYPSKVTYTSKCMYCPCFVALINMEANVFLTRLIR